MKQIRQRLAISAVLISAVVLLLLYSQHPIGYLLFVGAIALLGAGASLEYFRLAASKCTLHPLRWVGCAGVVAYIISTAIAGDSHVLAILPQATLAVTIVVAFVTAFSYGIQPLVTLAVTVFGVIYLGLALSCLIPIVLHEGDGRLWVAYLLVVTKSTDIGAYFVGVKLGKRPLAPALSPNKTIEGALGGLLVAVLCSLLFTLVLELSLLEAIILGLCMSVVAQVGDLAESLLKRDAGVKHSNRLPGMGGILDILDSLLFTTPLMYLFLQWNSMGAIA